MPWRTAESPKVASSLAMLRSQQRMICRPPPRHGPWIAATVATGIASIFASATSQRRKPIGARTVAGERREIDAGAERAARAG